MGKQAGSAAEGGGEGSEAPESDTATGQKGKKEKEDPQIVRQMNLTEFEGLTDDEDAWLVSFYSGRQHLCAE